MDTIPPELIRLILHHLPCKRDIANFRLVQRSLTHLAIPFLFQSISLKILPSSLPRLLSISCNPDIATHIKRVFLEHDPTQITIWPEFLEQMQLENISHDDERALEICESLVEEKLKFLDVFLDTFRGLSGLEDVALGSCFAWLPLPHSRPSEEHMNRYGLGRQGGKTLEYYTRTFMALINALYLGDIKLATFVFSDLRSPSLIHLSIFEDLVFLERATAVLQNCKTIKLGIQQQNDQLSQWFQPSSSQEHPLFHVLSSAAHLQTLFLETIFQQTEAQAREGTALTFFPCILGRAHTWPNLTQIQLQTVHTHYSEFTSFLRRHEKTLRKVTIRWSRLFTGYWTDVMIFIRENLRLSYLYLCTLCDGDMRTYRPEVTKMMASYALKKGDRLLP